MDFNIPEKRRAIKKVETNPLQELYPHAMQFYKLPPTGVISLDEFQDLAIERQKVLQLLEANLSQPHESLDNAKQAFLRALKKEESHHYARLVSDSGAEASQEIFEARRRDHISHFILRLAYCSTDELAHKLIRLETELFKLRFSSLSKECLVQYLNNSGLHYSLTSKEFKDGNKNNLTSSSGIKEENFESTDFYELPFEEVVGLLIDRKVYLHRGSAYVPHTDLISVFVSHYRSNLSFELNRSKNCFIRSLDDERLQMFLKSLPECFAGMSKLVWVPENIPITKLTDLSKTSYPLCMRVMHEHLLNDHHLKNTGRLQYGLFLKGIGVTLDGSLEFWRNEMLKNPECTEEKFKKEYEYQIKYNYGKLGRRVDYRPHACYKLITDSVGPEEVHGCPYKHWDMDELSKKLAEYKIPATSITEITKLASEGHYNIACTKYFINTHEREPGKMIWHPNQYYEESRVLPAVHKAPDDTK